MPIYNLEVRGTCTDIEALETALFTLAGGELADVDICVKTNDPSVQALLDAWGIAQPRPMAITNGYVSFADDSELVAQAELRGKDVWVVDTQ